MKVVVYDYSVFCHNWQHKLDSFLSVVNLINLEKLQSSKDSVINEPVRKLAKLPIETLTKYYAQALWIKDLTLGPSYIKLGEFYPVLVKDSKPYWRSKLVENYKGKRPDKTNTFHLSKTIGEALARKLSIPILEFPSQEADDVAASFIKFWQLAKEADLRGDISNVDHIYLWTVDSDWIQLVSDEVTWLNTGPWEPLIRDPITSLDWVKKRLKVSLDHVQDIVAVKCIQGDKSDNLPPGTKPEIIDLMNPPEEFRLLHSQVFNKTLQDLTLVSNKSYHRLLRPNINFLSKIDTMIKILEYL